MKLVLGALGFLAFVAALIFGARFAATRDQPAPRAPANAPPIASAGADGNGGDDGDDGDAPSGAAPHRTPPLPALFVFKGDKQIALAGPRKKPLLLHLWASWCGPCRAELPGLLAFARKKGDVDVLAVSVDDYWEPVEKFFTGAVPPEVVWDKKITLERALGVDSIPTTFLVDTAGNVVDRFDGAHDWSDPRIEAVLAADLH